MVPKRVCSPIETRTGASFNLFLVLEAVVGVICRNAIVVESVSNYNNNRTGFVYCSVVVAKWWLV